jgi:hypothetical protein
MNHLTRSKPTTALFFIMLALVCFGLLPNAQAVVPPPDGSYPGGNTAEGQAALLSLTTGGFNTAIGYLSLRSNTTNSFNTAVGAGTLLANTADENTATGAGALLSNTTGSNNTANGAFALFSNTTGFNNTAIGASAGANQTTGSNNVYIGAGMSGVAGEGFACYIANIFSQTSTTGIPVLVNAFGKLGTSTSSKRFKEAIKPMDKASEALLALKPVTFRYKKEIDPAAMQQFGLVAEEVEKVNPDLVVRDTEGKPYSVRYDQVNAMLLNEFLKEHRKVEQQHKDLEAALAQQQKQIEALAAGLQKVSAQLAAASPSRGGLEARKFAIGRIRRGGTAPQVVNNP